MGFFAGKVVIVTGSSNGIGRATAALFAAQGASVTITGRNSASLQETKRLCLDAGAKESSILELIGDVTDASFSQKLVTDTIAKFGQLDVLVNNVGAAVFANFGKAILDIPLAEFDQMIDVNVRQVIRLSQLAVPHLEKTKGAIVNVSSIFAYHHVNPLPYLCAAKSALDQVTVQMAGSLIKKGIRVNSVNPGPVATNAVVTAGGTEEMKKEMRERWDTNPAIPLGRISTSEDIGKLILFLADRTQSEILIGHIMTADGGLTLKSAMFPDA